MSFAHPSVNEELISDVLTHMLHEGSGIHGLWHWRRVERNGLFLAAREGGDAKVVALFALFHDSQRLNDSSDPEHGERGGRLAAEFHATGRLPITLEQLDTLIEACHRHTDVRHSPAPTIQCCWDADRLDLTRIGVRPDPAYLNTPTAKGIAESGDYSEVEAFLTHR
ncbi:hypothetical protein [Alienimonas chondri]|uniref:HD domain-containing protein n=1 Tax=Alienimonas chondri TaxID=2681879 RepID=A0ABX1VFZ5_9PLAN|nr:hypothetical protein [Alienimonas chondri]NNJ27025.1 hypothetical protein [Alienimonas chondri]